MLINNSNRLDQNLTKESDFDKMNIFSIKNLIKTESLFFYSFERVCKCEFVIIIPANVV